MKHTDSRKGEQFDPLKPTCHFDVDQIIYQNNLMLNNATQLVNKTQKKLIELNNSFYKSTEIQQIKLQVDIDQLQRQLADYEDHLQYCINSLEQAQQLKLDIDQEI